MAHGSMCNGPFISREAALPIEACQARRRYVSVCWDTGTVHMTGCCGRSDADLALNYFILNITQSDCAVKMLGSRPLAGVIPCLQTIKVLKGALVHSNLLRLHFEPFGLTPTTLSQAERGSEAQAT